MNSPCGRLGWAAGCAVLLAAAAGPAWAADEAAGAAAAEPLLRHRVAVVAVPAAGGATNPPAGYALNAAWTALLLQEGITITPDEWASAVDLTKSGLARSEDFRLTDVAPGEAEGAPRLVLFARYGVGTGGARAFLRLVDASGAVVSDADAAAATMKQAVDKALAEVAGEVALRPWLARVVSVQEGTVVMDRGQLDGVREGQEFAASVVAASPTNAPPVSEERRLLESGRAAGRYAVVETSANYAKLRPLEGAAALKAGDVVQLPEIRLRDRQRTTRGRRLWDRLYGEDR